MEDKKELNKESSKETNVKSEKSKLETWLRDKYNLALFGIITLAVIIRIYLFSIVKDQAHWWDSLAFGSIAKQITMGLWPNDPFIIHELALRPPLFSLMWAFLLKLNISDIGILLILEIIPSILSVYLVFLIVKEFYDKRTALLSSFIFSVLWINLFYTMRIMSDIPSLFFSLLAIYFFIKSYENFNTKKFALAIFFISLAIMTRYFYGIIGAVFLVFVLLKHKHKFLANKQFWIGGIIGVLPIIIFLIFNLMNYGSLLPASSLYAQSTEGKPIAIYVLDFITYDISPQASTFGSPKPYLGFSPFFINPFSSNILSSNLMIFFIIGFIIIFIETVLGFDSILKVKKLESNLFFLLIFIFSFIFFIFVLRAAEDRYVILPLISILVMTSSGIFFAYDKIKKYSKNIAIIFLILVILTALYSNVSFGNNLIKNKAQSYSQMKEAFLWIKDNTPKDAVILGDGIDPYVIYYSERKYEVWNITDLQGSVQKADYIVIHAFEHQTQESANYANNNLSSMLTPQKIVFFDQIQQQPAVVIYKVNK
ncbi:glycosyltransferase family 39 protein [Candidatus Pacearchaeota archaeon]|nr:glycosyltransferase family 39 protein [Candidatus Pacearchaeota archaeon]